MYIEATRSDDPKLFSEVSDWMLEFVKIFPLHFFLGLLKK